MAKRMIPKAVTENFEETLSHRLQWAMNSTLKHFLRKPDHNMIEDWADTTAMEVDENIDDYTRAARVHAYGLADLQNDQDDAFKE